MADRARTPPLVAADDAVVRRTAVHARRPACADLYLWLPCRADGLQLLLRPHADDRRGPKRSGSRVNVGQVVGTVGNSGDARGGATHVHFEIRQEWTSMNPYRDLVAVDRQRT